jgi:hypothetical protein
VVELYNNQFVPKVACHPQFAVLLAARTVLIKTRTICQIYLNLVNTEWGSIAIRVLFEQPFSLHLLPSETSHHHCCLVVRSYWMRVMSFEPGRWL